MSDIAIEKGPFAYEEEHFRASSRSRNVPAVVAHTYTHAAAPEKAAFGNPAPVGFFATALTVFIFSLYGIQTRGVTIHNAGVGMACFFGGLCQFIAGMWAFAAGNTFAANAFTAYGGFWLAYTPFLLPDWGITTAYENNAGQLPNALGIMLAAWTILTTIFLLGTLRLNMLLILFFFLLDVYFLILTISEFTNSVTLQKIAGGEGIVLSFVAFYAAAANLLDEDNSWITLPVGNLNRG